MSLLVVLGAGFELLGLWLVAQEIGHVQRAELQKPTRLDRAQAWVRQRVGLSKTVERAIGVSVLPAIETSMAGTVTPRGPESLEDKVRRLEVVTEDLRRAQGALEGRLRKEIQEVSHRASAIADELQERDKARLAVVEKQLSYKRVGTVCFAFGVVLTAFGV